MKSISHTTTEDVKLVTSEEFTLSSSTLLTTKNLFQDSLIPEEDSDHSSNNKNTPILVDDGSISETRTHLQWTRCGRIVLTSKDKQLILNGSKLKYNHINAFHNIAKVQFPLKGGFHNTLLLNKTVLNLEDYEQSLQIMFIPDRSHWALLQVVRSDV